MNAKAHSNKQYDHGVRTFRPTSPLPTPGEKSTINRVFYVHPNNVYTSQYRFSTLTDQRHSSHSVSSSPKTSLHTRFLAHRKPYNTHNVTNINLFSTIDENTMKAQLKVTISHHPTILCMKDTISSMWVCVTMSKIKSNSNSKLAIVRI